MHFVREKFKTLRKEKKLSISKIALQIGKSYRTIIAWENGERNPAETDVRVLAQILNVHVGDISDLPDLNKSELPYYHSAINDYDALNYETESSFSAEQKMYILKLKSESEKLKSELKTLKRSSYIKDVSLNSIPTCVYVKDQKLKYIYANSNFLSYIKLSLNDILGKTSNEIFNPKEITELSLLEQKVLNSGKDIASKKIQMPGGDSKRIATIYISPVFDENEITTKIVCSMNEITHDVVAEDRLHLIEMVLNLLSESVWVMACEPVPHFIFFSASVANIFGRTPDEFYKNNKLWIDAVYPEDKQELLKINSENKFPRTNEYRIIHKSGEVKWIESKRFRYKHESGKTILFGILRDITKERISIAKLERLQETVNKFDQYIWYGEFKKDNINDFEIHYSNSFFSNIFSKKEQFTISSKLDFLKYVHEEDELLLKNWLNTDEYPKFIKYRVIINGNLKWFFNRIFKDGNKCFGAIEDITGEQLLIYKYKVLDDIINKSNDVVWVGEKIPNTTFFKLLYLNKAAERISGYTQQEFFDDPSLWQSRIDKNDVNFIHESVIQEESQLFYKYRFTSKNGEIKHLRTRVFRYDQKMYFGFIENITVEESDSLMFEIFKEHLNNQENVFWIKKYRPFETYIFISKSVEKLTGYSSSEMNVKLWKSIIHPADIPKVENVHSLVYENRPRIVYRIVRKDGKIVKIEDIKLDKTSSDDTGIGIGIIRVLA